MVELLDNLNKRLPSLQAVLDIQHLKDLPLKLLARGLKTHGDQLDTEHLYDWLSVRSDRMRNSLNNQAIQEIRSWLEQRPTVQKAVILEGLSRCPESDKFRGHAIKAQNRLYGASPPSDFGPWCLKQADALADTKPLIAEYLFGRAFNEVPLEVLQEHTQGNETLKVYLDRLLDSIAEATEFEEQWQQEKQQQEQEQQQQHATMAFFYPLQQGRTKRKPSRTLPTLQFSTGVPWTLLRS